MLVFFCKNVSFHFWIPQINLFQDLPPHKLRSLSKVLDKVIQNPSPYIQPPQTQPWMSCCKIADVNAPVLVDNVSVDVMDYEEPVVITYTNTTTTADPETQQSTLSRDANIDDVNRHLLDEVPESSIPNVDNSCSTSKPQNNILNISPNIVNGNKVLKSLGTSEVHIVDIAEPSNIVNKSVRGRDYGSFNKTAITTTTATAATTTATAKDIGDCDEIGIP